VFGGFHLSEPSARVFDEVAGRVGAAVAGRETFEHSSRFGGGSPHPSAPLVVVSHQPILHQVPVLLGGGRSFFGELAVHVDLRLLQALPAPGVTHLHYEVVR
jgi:hypothetical protein